MPETRVVHCKRKPFDVYIGRPSMWGNPFSHLSDAKEKGLIKVPTREDAVREYAIWIGTQPHLLRSLKHLRGKALGCWCAPHPCHGDVLAKLADELPDIL